MAQNITTTIKPHAENPLAMAEGAEVLKWSRSRSAEKRAWAADVVNARLSNGSRSRFMREAYANLREEFRFDAPANKRVKALSRKRA